MFVVYKIEHEDGPEFGLYIGGTFKNPARRWSNHKSCARRESRRGSSLYNTMRRYGADKFVFRVLSEHPDVRVGDKESAARIERAAIKEYKPNLNDRRGGAGFSATGKKPVVYEGVVYPSRVALARKLGLCNSTIGGAIRRGRMDTLGKGRPKGQCGGGTPPVPVTLDGVDYPSYSAAGRALGLSDNGVRKRVAKQQSTQGEVT